MKAMILAAGEGRRMRPLTDTIPKPLLQVQGKSLLEHHILRLAQAEVREIIINVAYLGDLIQESLGDGAQFGVEIQYSIEPSPLETAGALWHAQTTLGQDPFILVNGDVWTDYPFAMLREHTLRGLGHLVLVPNPPFKTNGDFSIGRNSELLPAASQTYTFAGISMLSPQLLTQYPSPKRCMPLKPLLDWGIQQKSFDAEVYRGVWSDVGTPERLAKLNQVSDV